MASGVSINTSSSGAEGIPSQCRAFGCRVEGEGHRITVFLAAFQAVDLLRDVAGGRAIAVVFSDPATHRTLQVKGRDAQAEPLVEGDAARVSAYRTDFVQRLRPLGFTEPMIRALLDCPEADLVAVGFTPDSAFNQTPGLQAGAPLVGGAG